MVTSSDQRRSARLFTLRVWTEPIEGGIEHRGRVRDVETGAHRSFRDWSALVAFLTEQLAEQLTEQRATKEA